MTLGAMVEQLEQLDYTSGFGFESRLGQQVTGKLPMSFHQFYESGNGKEAKGKGWTPPFIFWGCPYSHYGKPLPFMSYSDLHCM